MHFLALGKTEEKNVLRIVRAFFVLSRCATYFESIDSITTIELICWSYFSEHVCNSRQDAFCNLRDVLVVFLVFARDVNTLLGLMCAGTPELRVFDLVRMVSPADALRIDQDYARL